MPHARIRVRWSTEQAVFAISDVDFAISRPAIVVTSANGAGSGSPVA